MAKNKKTEEKPKKTEEIKKRWKELIEGWDHGEIEIEQYLEGLEILLDIALGEKKMEEYKEWMKEIEWG